MAVASWCIPFVCCAALAAICVAACADSSMMLASDRIDSPARCTSATPCSAPLLPSSVTITAVLVACWISFRMSRTRAVASRDCSANCRTSIATTAKPLPSSPARAASMLAFSASSFDCSAISFTVAMISPICCVRSDSARMFWAMLSTR